MYDPNMTLFANFKLKDLTITKTGLSNLPKTKTEFDNLVWLAKVLDQLRISLGPFTIISAFRTAEVQKAVAGKNFNPNSKSFHEIGIAADIYPLGQTIDAYFGKMITNEWKTKLGEIIIKPTQNSIHISLPTKTVRGKTMILDGAYRLLTSNEIEQYSVPYLKFATPISFSSNDDRSSYNDPSGGLYSDLFLGLFGVYPQTKDEELNFSFYDPAEGDQVRLNKALVGGSGLALLLLAGSIAYMVMK